MTANLRFRAVAAATAVALATAAAPAAERVGTIDARTVEGAAVVVSADKVEITVDGKKESLPRADVAEIVLAAAKDPMTRKGQAVLMTSGQARLAVSNVRLAGGKLSFDNTLLGRTEIPLEAGRTLLLPDANLTPAEVEQRGRDLAKLGGAGDRLIVARTETEWEAADGVLKGIDTEKITFNLDDADRTIAVAGVRAVWLSALGEKPAAPAGFVEGVDGSQVGFTALAMDAKSVEIDVPGLGHKKLSRADVAAVRFVSDRVKPLTDLTPAEVKHHGLMDAGFPHRVNRSAGGKELKLGGRMYPAGLGMHSFCELTYDLGGAYTTFVAMAGIDDAVRPAGDATLTILGDGKELDKPLRLTGKTDPQLLRVKVAGVKKLTLRVDFGEDKLDVADHVDLCEARLIK